MPIIDFIQRAARAWSLLDAADISDQNRADIRAFVEFKVAQRVSPARQAKYLGTLRLLAERHLGGREFRELTREDVVAIVAKIERSKLQPWSKTDYEYFLKTFMTWLGKPETVAWIKARTPRRRPDETLTYEDVQKLLAAAHSPRDKALIAALFESGARIAEIGNLRRGDLKFDQFCATATVSGKTGIYPIYFVWAAPYLAQWLEAHPLREDTAPLWVTGTRPMRYEAIRRQLQRIAARAGVTKRVNPHNFRHSRLTLYSKERKLSEAMIKQLMGLTPDSRVLNVYRHLTGADVRDAVLEMHGLAASAASERPQVRQCPFCQAVNTNTAVICIACRRPLSVAELVTQEQQVRGLFEDLLQLSLEDPEVTEAVRRYFDRKRIAKP